MRACQHDDVPSGGMVGGLIGAIDGPAIAQMRGGQIGGMSIELLHSGCMSPSTHWHVQEASARALSSKAAPPLRHRNTRFISSPSRSADRSHKTPRAGVTPSSALTFVLYMFS
jgi:hypothetical protein